MIRVSLKAFAALAFAAAVAPALNAQHYSSCQPTCAVPQGPTCAVPPVPCDPTCAVPSGCSSCGDQGPTCYQPQQVNCEPRRGWFGGGMRPLFNWTKIEVENRERCCQPQAQCCQTAQPAMAMPMMTMQPVQIQMTAYQPMMAAPQFVQAAPQFVQAAPQFVQAAPQFVQAAPQFVQAAPQYVAAPQLQQVTLRPQVAVAPQSASDECNLSNVCEKLALLRQKVDDLESRIGSSNSTAVTALEKRIDDNEKAIRLQTEILDDIRNHLKSEQ